jgi:hypothetical protein
MSEFVIKYWRYGSKPVDEQGNYVHIVGRRAGVWARLLTLLRVDPGVKLLVGLDRIELRQASLSGSRTRMIALESLSSTFYGQHKSWGSALLLLAVFTLPALLLAGWRGEWVLGLGLLVTGLVVAGLRYFLHNTLVLGLQEVGGKVSRVRFRPTVIESVAIDEQQARQVCKVIQRLMDAKRKRMLLSLGARSGS